MKPPAKGQRTPKKADTSAWAALRKPAFWMIAGGFLAVYLNHGILMFQ